MYGHSKRLPEMEQLNSHRITSDGLMVNITRFIYICSICIPIQQILISTYSNFNRYNNSF